MTVVIISLGVPGIGVKTAAELINQFDNLDQLLTRASEIKQNKKRENIEFGSNKCYVIQLYKINDFKNNCFISEKIIIFIFKKNTEKCMNIN